MGIKIVGNTMVGNGNVIRANVIQGVIQGNIGTVNQTFSGPSKKKKVVTIDCKGCSATIKLDGESVTCEYCGRFYSVS